MSFWHWSVPNRPIGSPAAAQSSSADIDLIMSYLEALDVAPGEAALAAAVHVREHGARDPQGLAEKRLRQINLSHSLICFIFSFLFAALTH